MVQFEKQNPEESEQTKLLDYEKIVVSKEFQQMISDKKKFVIPFTIFLWGIPFCCPS